jgi:hypothetical protein
VKSLARSHSKACTVWPALRMSTAVVASLSLMMLLSGALLYIYGNAVSHASNSMARARTPTFEIMNQSPP